MAKCNCPNPASLTTINISDCPVDLDQIQKIYFQRQGFIFDGTVGKDITLLADWQTLVTAGDDTKVVVTPLIGGDPVITAGEAITTGGGDNTTLNGVVETTGTNPSQFSVTFKSLSAEEEKALKTLACEGKLGAYFVNRNEQLIVNEVATGEYTGFEVFGNVFFSDRNNAGFGTKDTFTMTFSLKAGWSEDLSLQTPADFNPLTDLDQ